MNTEQPSYYAIIPAAIRYSELTSSEKLLYAEITALCNKTGECWASNAYFARLYDVAKRTVSRWVSRLEKDGYISVVLHYREGTKEVERRSIRLTERLPMDTNVPTPMDKDEPTPPDTDVPDNNTRENTKRFVKPTPEDVGEYAKKIGFASLDPEYFVDYNEARGWKYGGNTPIRDWKAVVRTWKKNEERRSGPVSQPVSNTPPKEKMVL